MGLFCEGRDSIDERFEMGLENVVFEVDVVDACRECEERERDDEWENSDERERGGGGGDGKRSKSRSRGERRLKFTNGRRSKSSTYDEPPSSTSLRPSTIWWKSNTRCARSDMKRRPVQSRPTTIDVG